MYIYIYIYINYRIKIKNINIELLKYAKKRCFCYTKNTNYKIKCKNTISFEINNKFYCFIHSKKIYNEYAIYIQKIYRSFYIRKKIKNLFINLPYDIRIKILFYIKRKLLNKKI